MGDLWKEFSIISSICICLGASMAFFSMKAFVKTRKQIAYLLEPGERLPPWYIDATLRKQSELFVDGILLILLMASVAVPFKQLLFSLLWDPTIVFLYACSIIVFMIARERGQRRIAQKMGESLPRWRSNFDSHRRIATAIFWLGISVMLLLSKLAFLERDFSIIVGLLGISLVLIGGFYLLVVRMIPKFKRL
jgi:hypothetical protein